MTGTRDRFGEPIEPIEERLSVPPNGEPLNASVPPNESVPGFVPPNEPRTPDEIRAHCAALRAVLAEARARREAQP